MSHAATNWAIQQKGMKPATKLVLWHLCDRYNPDRGCFPSQERLAADCEMSRSALNCHLNTLVKRGLIRRIKDKDAKTNRVKSTHYKFAFEDGFEPENSESRVRNPDTEAVSGKSPEPCPENGKSRVRNPDTNPVREPLREPARARGDDPDGSPRGAEEASVEGDALRRLRRAERKVLLKWVLNGDVEPLDTIALSSERKRFPISGSEAMDYALTQSATSVRRVAGFAQWAFDILDGKPCGEEPIDDVRRIIAELERERFGERVRARCQTLIDWRKANPVEVGGKSSAGDVDPAKENQQTEDAA